jgi:pentose-5-phosphate-3-epimerase
MLLLMTVEPGFGGQAFLDVVLPKIRRARQAIGDAEVWLQVDGGVSEQTIAALRRGRRGRLRRRRSRVRQPTTRPRRCGR